MDELQEIDVEQVMDRIRENIRRRRTGEKGFSPSDQRAGINPAPTEQGAEPRPYGTGGGTPPLRTDGRMTADLASLRSGYDIYHVHLTSHRKIVGSFIVFLKKLLQTLLTPFFERQVAYNATNVRVATYLKEQIDALGQQQAQIVQIVEDKLARFEEEVQTAHAQELQGLRGELEGRLAQIEEPLQNQARALQVLRERIPGTERKLRRILHMLTDGQEVGEGFTPSRQLEEAAAQVELRKVPRQTLEPDFDYFAFEERFRGSEEDVKERQRNYVEYFRGKGDVLDIGCGRGEFLELLKESGIQAKGVDLNLDMVLVCREKGLDVVREDAFVYLEALPDETLGGVFAAQVIEHLEPSRVIQLVRLCHRKLRQGGILILETLNPKCLKIFAESFYMDLSHTRPIHPEAMRFLLESTGFENVELKFSAPVESSVRVPVLPDAEGPGTTFEDFNRGIERLNDLLYGFQDYAIIGGKNTKLHQESHDRV